MIKPEIRIINPCNAKWEEMLPDEHGRHCKICSKSVHDLTDKTDLEIYNLFNDSRRKELCGRLRTDQLDQNKETEPNYEKNVLFPKVLFKLGFTPKTALIAALIITVNLYVSGCRSENTDYNNKSGRANNIIDSLTYNGGMVVGNLPVMGCVISKNSSANYEPIELTQYRDNPVTNRSDMPIFINRIKISPHKNKIIRINGEDKVTIAIGSISKTVQTIPNRKPQISFMRIVSMNEDTKVTILQKTVCYRIKINDDYPEQLEVKIDGPVNYKKVSSSVYDVSMKAFPSKSEFENYSNEHTSPFSIGFTVTVTDKIAPHKITAQETFIFGEW